MRRGFTITELLVVVAIFGATAMVAVPLTRDAYERHQVQVAATQVQSLVQQVRMNAVKEKVQYRLGFLNESDDTPNRVVVQKEESGSFATQDTYELPGAVRLLSESMSRMTVSEQGTCSSGTVYFQGERASYQAVSIKTTCLTETP